MIRVVLPYHLRQLANTGRVVEVNICAPVTVRTIVDALETKYPMLLGTVRDAQTGQRRNFIRFFACGEDLSHIDPETPLPQAVIRGEEEFMIVGAMAGG